MKKACSLLGLAFVAAWVGLDAETQRAADRNAFRLSLPRVTDLPQHYRPIGTLAGRGTFHAAGAPSHRIDDGDAHHGLSATTAWAAKPKDKRAQTQGALYGVAEGAIISAGYVIRQADLVAARAFTV